MDARRHVAPDHCQTTPYAGGGVARSRYNPAVNRIQERA
jgi:hypothetical protein